MIRVLASLSDKGDGVVNEDLFGYGRDSVWLLDGATGVSPPRLDPVSDAAWFVRRADHYLKHFVKTAPAASTQALVRDVIGQLHSELENGIENASERHWPPSAAAIVVRRTGGQGEFFALGDCSALMKSSDGEIDLIDGRAGPPLDARSISKLIACQNEFPGAPHDEIVARLKPVLRENRSAMNTPDGYWILSTEEAAADHGRLVSQPCCDTPFILMSDGFSRGMEMLGDLSFEAFFTLIIDQGPEAVLQKIRAVEHQDADCRRFPRFKVHDDATCAVLRWE